MHSEIAGDDGADKSEIKSILFQSKKFIFGMPFMGFFFIVETHFSGAFF